MHGNDEGLDLKKVLMNFNQTFPEGKYGSFWLHCAILNAFNKRRKLNESIPDVR